MSTPPVSLVPVLAESLDALESHQRMLIERLKAIHTRLLQGDEPEDELVPTLTFYISQAGLVQRKMVLLRARVGDMKRRADRLKAHRAKQDQMVAEWMAQERQRQVPAAQASPALAQLRALGSMSRHDTASLPPSPMPDSSEQDGPRSMPAMRSLPEGLASRCTDDDDDDDGLGIAVLELPALMPSALTASSMDRGSSGLGIETIPRSLTPRSAAPAGVATAAAAVDSSHASSPDSALAVTTIKRKGKRRVRVPTIE
ncbi:hypothetical protein IWW37_003896 [Coemansia sp. RSA 2050]|nr:hypothetical protein IWW37_003896 [Coemansia sp. RSA 2050]KAJ2732155.1 hypothetical protein IW152_004015 [Coemansia sp. BCRC 34962]